MAVRNQDLNLFPHGCTRHAGFCLCCGAGGCGYEQNCRVLNSNCRWNLNFELQRFSPACELKQERKTRCCTRRSTGIRRPVPSYYEGTAHPIPVLLRVQHLVFLSCFSLQAGEYRWSSKFKIQRQLEFKTRPFCSYPHPPSPQHRQKPACRVHPGANSKPGF